VTARDRAPTAADAAAAARPVEADLEALFREVRRDAARLVAGARTPQEALEAVSGMMTMELEVGDADTEA